MKSAPAKYNTAGMPDQYQAEDDVRTLHRANQIKADKKRHGAAKAHAKKMAAQMAGVAAGGEPDADDKGV